jgi:hypothetical protein
MAAIADHYASIAIPSPKYLLEICSAQTEYFEKNEVYDYKGYIPAASDAGLESC